MRLPFKRSFAGAQHYDDEDEDDEDDMEEDSEEQDKFFIDGM